MAFLKDQNMFIYKVFERAGESIIDALAICVVSESYPDHLSILVDALIDLLKLIIWKISLIEGMIYR